MTALQRFRHVEWPAVRPALPGLAGLIFLLCFTSFALVLMLGGGPKVTTLEVEIYSAIRFDFNISAAAGVSLIQFVLAAIIVAATTIFGGIAVLNSSSQYTHQARFDLATSDLFHDIGILALLSILVVMPVVMAGLNGFNEGLIKILNRPQFWEALHTSAQVSVITATIVTLLGIIMATAKAGLSLPHRYGSAPFSKYLRVLMDQGMMLYLVMPSIVLGTSAFIFLRERGDVFGYAFVVVIVANSLLALPFAYRLLEVRMSQILAHHDKLAGQLGLFGLSRLLVLTMPALKRDIGLVAGLSAALSFGDLGVIALFANSDFRTLPWLLYQLAGRYAADEANALAMILMVLTVLLFLGTRAAAGRIIGGNNA